MSPTDNTPNFDNMTPEEIMAWMESLAKRQGATEGLTTAADLDIPEIDPTSVVIDEPGYVPYGQEDKMKKAAASPPPPPPVMAPPPPVAPPPPAVVAPIIQPAAQRAPAPPPVAPPPPPVYTRPSAPPPPVYQRPLEMPPPPVAPPPPPPVVDTPLESAIGEDALSWLQSLAADQGVPDFNLDLSSLEPEMPLATPTPKSDPVSWLQGLADETIPASPPPASSDPAAWLGSIATEAGMPVEEYELPEPLSLESPIAALDMFAVEAGFEDDAVRAVPEMRQQPAEDMSIEGIERAIREGRVTPEQIRHYQEVQMERAAAREDVVDEVFEDEAPAQPVEIPDWLQAMKPAEPEPPPQTGALRPLESLFDSVAPVSEVSDVPDWLVDEGSDTENIEAIFAIDDVSPVSTPAKPEIAVDQNDPWVAALDEEFQMGASEDDEPEWYRRNISDPARIAAVTGEMPAPIDSEPAAAAFFAPEEPVFVPPPAAQAEPIITITLPAQLADAALPAETSLPAGERQAVPEFMRITSTQTVPIVVAPEPPVETAAPQAEALPNWLVTDEQQQPMLDWLTPVEAEPEPARAEIIFSPPPPPPVIAPVLPPPLPASSSLTEARSRYQSGDVGGSVVIYELLVRASQSLADVANDLATMAREKKDPVIFRVLGDSLMRQGRLQEALNTYRDALNLL
ncbi:MAG: hypothetical protein SF123_12730 [Chloroflexota bacterium]|nr:hypothetical protein [Chloroflexota bacterium]